MGKFADELARYKSGQITSDALVRWVATNINRSDSRLHNITDADRYDEAEREYWREMIYAHPEPDTAEEVLLAAAMLAPALYAKLMLASDPRFDAEAMDNLAADETSA